MKRRYFLINLHSYRQAEVCMKESSVRTGVKCDCLKAEKNKTLSTSGRTRLSVRCERPLAGAEQRLSDAHIQICMSPSVISTCQPLRYISSINEKKSRWHAFCLRGVNPSTQEKERKQNEFIQLRSLVFISGILPASSHQTLASACSRF